MPELHQYQMFWEQALKPPPLPPLSSYLNALALFGSTSILTVCRFYCSGPGDNYTANVKSTDYSATVDLSRASAAAECN